MDTILMGLHNHSITSNKPVYNTLEGFISQLYNPYSKEIKVLETGVLEVEVVFLCDKINDMYTLKQIFAEKIFKNTSYFLNYRGVHSGSVESPITGQHYTRNFTILFDKDEFDNYTGVNNNITNMKNKESTMQKGKSKQKKRLSTKVNITYTNGKSYLIKDVVEKVNIHPTFINVCYNEVRKLDGVSLASPRTVANIPTKDISMITILPENNCYIDSKVHFMNGEIEVVLNMVQKGVSYSGNVYFNV